MLVLIQNRLKNWLLGLITDYHTSCHWKFITVKCALYKKCDAPYPFGDYRTRVRRLQSKGLHWSTHAYELARVIWLYVRSTTCDVAFCSPQMTRSARLTIAITYLDNSVVTDSEFVSESTTSDFWRPKMTVLKRSMNSNTRRPCDDQGRSHFKDYSPVSAISAKHAADVWCHERAAINSRHVDPHSFV